MSQILMSLVITPGQHGAQTNQRTDAVVLGRGSLQQTHARAGRSHFCQLMESYSALSINRGIDTDFRYRVQKCDLLM